MNPFRKLKLLAGNYTNERAKFGDLRRFRKRTRSVVEVTCRGKTDGGGAQLHAIMSAFAFCKAEGIQYVHTPMTSIADMDRNGAVA